MREQRGPEPGEPPATREPPHNLEAEHFADTVNGRIFGACGEIATAAR
ncbi:hypothetical protein [Thalassobaculum sp.]